MVRSVAVFDGANRSSDLGPSGVRLIEPSSKLVPPKSLRIAGAHLNSSHLVKRMIRGPFGGPNPSQPILNFKRVKSPPCMMKAGRDRMRGAHWGPFLGSRTGAVG
ncbi:hypothetical protein JTE90_005152 [Oedothorax gibbosus]|uniref:Uncharacterized protein n=1 Tax=Oedothorax gibbosus TaxID=931172 RepID=A0AAV6TI51_9ARAC|nr:hypothetical protein JTE90_005152 [Oedothorax gibbosus]